MRNVRRSAALSLLIVACTVPGVIGAAEKPIFADIHADWCAVCNVINPTLRQVRQRYRGRIAVVTFDVTNEQTSQRAEQEAKRLHLLGFFNGYRNQTGAVAVIDPKTRSVLQVFYGENDPARYAAALDKALARPR